MAIRTAAFVLGVVCAIATGAQAQEPAAEAADQWDTTPAFTDIDADQNGSISASEAEGTWLAESFTRVDANKDGFVDEEEYKHGMS